MESQGLLRIGDLIEDCQWIGCGLLSSLRGGSSLDPTTDEDTDRKDQTRKHRAADEKKEYLSTIETAAAGRWSAIDRHAPTFGTGLGRYRNHVCFAVALHRI